MWPFRLLPSNSASSSLSHATLPLPAKLDTILTLQLLPTGQLMSNAPS